MTCFFEEEKPAEVDADMAIGATPGVWAIGWIGLFPGLLLMEQDLLGFFFWF
jgi:hypothetical protein